jgi:hypothetical protein
MAICWLVGVLLTRFSCNKYPEPNLSLSRCCVATTTSSPFDTMAMLLHSVSASSIMCVVIMVARSSVEENEFIKSQMLFLVDGSNPERHACLENDVCAVSLLCKTTYRLWVHPRPKHLVLRVEKSRCSSDDASLQTRRPRFDCILHVILVPPPWLYFDKRLAPCREVCLLALQKNEDALSLKPSAK